MEFLDFSDAEISPGTVYVENSLTNPLFPNQLAEPGVGETTLDLGTGIDVRNYCGLEDHQRHQQQSVTPDQPGPKSNAFPTGTCHAVHHELRNSLKHQQESAPMEGTMNVNNISMNHQAVLEQPAVDLKKLAKQRNDLRYRQRKKEETKDLKRKVDELMEREKHLANENDSLKKDGARMEKALKQSKRDVHQLKEKNDGLSTTVTEISRGLADSKYIEVQRENEVLKSNMNLLIKQMKNPNGSIIIQLQARIAELEREARARQLVIEALCAKMKRGTDDEREYE